MAAAILTKGAGALLFKSKKAGAQVDRDRIPRHIAAIMDGNGRWASARGLPRSAGHSAGAEAFRRTAEYLKSLGVSYFTVFAFSTENWRRPDEEVGAIMILLEKYLLESIRDMQKKHIHLVFWGDLSPLSPRLRALIDEVARVQVPEGGMQVNVCLNYGGRADLTRAARQLAEECARGTLWPEEVDEQALSSRLYSGGVPEPDLLIRTGGEYRISNFLLWQAAYTELYFTDTLWPDFSKAHVDRAILDFQKRKRRFGGIT